MLLCFYVLFYLFILLHLAFTVRDGPSPPLLLVFTHRCLIPATGRRREFSDPLRLRPATTAGDHNCGGWTPSRSRSLLCPVHNLSFPALFVPCTVWTTVLLFFIYLLCFYICGILESTANSGAFKIWVLKPDFKSQMISS